MLDNLKLGPIDGFSALVVIVAIVLAAVALIAVLIFSILKAVKEKKDAQEDKEENEFYAEYGVTGEELRLNQKLAKLRNLLKDKDVDNVDDSPVIPDVTEQPVQEQKEEPAVQTEPVAQETQAQEQVQEQVAADEVKAEVTEQPVSEPVAEPVEGPVAEPAKEEVKEEPVPVQEPAPVEAVAPAEPEKEAEPVKEEAAPAAPVEPAKEAEPVKEVEPVKEETTPVVEETAKAEPVVEEPVKEAVPERKKVEKLTTKKVVKKKPDDWSKYEGTYEGVYYDPEDACYYEGTPSPALAKKLAAKEAELEALNANKDKKVVIKKVAPPFAALKTPKNVRKAPQKVAGFDESVIYGKYVIEHVDKPDGSQEYFYTLYDASGNNIYESSNYTTKEFCERAINRFKSHAIIGTYTIETADGKYFFVLKRKTYVHKGSPQNTLEEANAHMREIKNFAQTDIVREQ